MSSLMDNYSSQELTEYSIRNIVRAETNSFLFFPHPAGDFKPNGPQTVGVIFTADPDSLSDSFCHITVGPAAEAHIHSLHSALRMESDRHADLGLFFFLFYTLRVFSHDFVHSLNQKMF